MKLQADKKLPLALPKPDSSPSTIQGREKPADYTHGTSVVHDAIALSQVPPPSPSAYRIRRSVYDGDEMISVHDNAEHKLPVEPTSTSSTTESPTLPPTATGPKISEDDGAEHHDRMDIGEDARIEIMLDLR